MLCSKHPSVLLTLSKDFREEDTYTPCRDEETEARGGETAKIQRR